MPNLPNPIVYAGKIAEIFIAKLKKPQIPHQIERAEFYAEQLSMPAPVYLNVIPKLNYSPDDSNRDINVNDLCGSLAYLCLEYPQIFDNVLGELRGHDQLLKNLTYNLTVVGQYSIGPLQRKEFIGKIIESTTNEDLKKFATAMLSRVPE